ncbi:MAG: DUF2973 domain-containing protein [Moorea sp. SIO2B7]|nr:DUF2973 domain-containing protein [Moorena sp. SIO2B7]
MLHIIYILAFTIIAFLAVSNLIRSLISVSYESQRPHSPADKPSTDKRQSLKGSSMHPELLDENGKPVNEPLLVMRSVSIEEAREQLDAIYKDSPGKTAETEE